MSIQTLIVVQSLQIAVLVVVVWLLSKTIARKNVHLSFALWLVVLAKSVTPPIWSSPVGVFSWLRVDVPQTELVAPPEVLGAEYDLSVPSSEIFSTFEVDTIEELPAAPVGQASFEPLIVDEIHLSSAEIERPLATAEPLSIWHSVFAWLPTAWLLIAALLMIGTVIRAWSYIRALAASSVEDVTLQNRADEINKRLGLKHRVQVLVTSSSVGPAVVGLFRPRIVVPEKLTQNFDGRALDPILAHELLHIRRGDLWIGLLRHSVSMLWWFHPFVWKTSKAIRLGAESCCDEEVISTLGISAKDYAQSLLSVLELKRELKAIPVAPGVRPFDITANRLEKIMTCEKHGRPRTPIWCWAVAVLLAIVSLPGASLMWGDESTAKPLPSLDHYLDSEEISTDASPEKSSAVADVFTGQENESELETSVDVKLEELPLSLLKRPKNAEPILEPGDVLGVYIDGVLGQDDQVLPVNTSGTAPSLGFPIPIRKDGTVPLPLIRPPKLSGLTLQQAEELVVDAYTVKTEVLKKDEQRIVITMIRPRHIEVLVFREDLVAARNPSENSFVLSIASNKADVITVLAKAGGLPAASVNEIVIHRDSRTIRIPLRYPAGKRPAIGEKDIVIQDGDIVTLKPGATNARGDGPNRIDSILPNASLESGKSTATAIVEVAQPAKVENPARRERHKMTLEEAISIALQNGNTQNSLGITAVEENTSQSAQTTLTQNPDFALSAYQVSRKFVVIDEIDIRNFVYEVSQAYWELYFQYQKLEAERTAFASAHATWKLAKARIENEPAGGEAANEAQSRVQYFAFKSRLQQAKSDLHQQELRLRYLLGMADDGRLIQPVDHPSKARVEYDWEEIKNESVSRSPELRRQRWRTRQNEIQLLAAKNQLGPETNMAELDESLAGDFAEWQTGFKFQQPIEGRKELTQVRNQQLQLKRARKRLEDAELELTQQLSAAVRRLRDRYTLAQTQFNALKAARAQVSAAEKGYKVSQNVPLDVVLDAQSRQAQSEVDYFRAISEYQIANEEVHYRKGSLLKLHGIELATKQQGANVESAIDQSFDLVPKETSVYGELGL